jgi:predicted PurR-regulated permease PerM
MQRADIQRWMFLLLIAGVSIAFAWIVWPFFGAMLWASILAIMLQPIYRGILGRMRGRRTLASAATVIVCLVLGVVPLALLIAALIREGTLVYQNVTAQAADFGTFFQSMLDALPAWMLKGLDLVGLGDLSALKDALSAAALALSRNMAGSALSLGQNTLDFLLNIVIMLYLLFFLLRDGDSLRATIDRALPLRGEYKHELSGEFASVIRATVKGNLVIALVQGVLGGLALAVAGVPAALLLGALMAVLSLLPLVGSILVWGPVGVYFLLAGALWKGIALLAFGTLVIGVVDNFLRPLLVGKDTQLPDYVVLISTLGGIALFGFNGFVVGPVVAALFVAVWGQFATAQAHPAD